MNGTSGGKNKLFSIVAGVFGIIALFFWISPMGFVPSLRYMSLMITAIFIFLSIKERKKIKTREEQLRSIDISQVVNSDKEELIKMIEPMIKAQLKSPISAIFCEPNELRIEYDIDSVYNIYGYVNSQNSYGAMIKTGFKVRARNSGSKWEVINAGMENKFVKTLATNYIIGIVIALILFAISYFIISSLL